LSIKLLTVYMLHSRGRASREIQIHIVHFRLASSWSLENVILDLYYVRLLITSTGWCSPPNYACHTWHRPHFVFNVSSLKIIIICETSTIHNIIRLVRLTIHILVILTNKISLVDGFCRRNTCNFNNDTSFSREFI